MSHPLRIIVTCFFVFPWLFGCSIAKPSQTQAHVTPTDTLAAQTQTTAYPEPTNIPLGTYYPAPREIESNDTSHPDTIVVPSPSSETGVITGQLLMKDSEEPYLNSLLVLGEVSNPDKEGFPPLVGFSIENDPKAIQAKNGVFVFDDVIPGNYGIVLWSPLSTFLLSDPTNGDTIFITVKAGETTNLGIIYLK